MSFCKKSTRLLPVLFQLSLASIFIIVTGQNAIGQTKTDFQTWYGASVKADFKKGWAFTAEYRARITKNATYYKGSYFFAIVDYRLNDFVEFTANYRLAIVDVGTFNRYAFGVEGRRKLGRFTPSFRPMVQYQNQYFNSDNGITTDTDTYLRTRLEVKYAISRRFVANLYLEPFFKLDKNANLDWWQNSVGLKYEYSKGKKLNLYYILQPDYTYKKLHVISIIGLDLEFIIKV